MCDLLVQAVLAHVPLELYLVCLDSWGGRRVGEDVTWTELVNVDIEGMGKRQAYAQRDPRAGAGSRGLSSDCRKLVDARGHKRRIGELWAERLSLAQ